MTFTRVTALLDLLLEQHRELRRRADGLVQELRGGDLTQVFHQMAELDLLFTEHLALERRRFFAPLLEMAAGSEAVAVVQPFPDGMQHWALQLAAFRGRYHGTEDLLDVGDFKAELKTLLQVLTQRLHDEEQTLHPLFLELERGLARAG